MRLAALTALVVLSFVPAVSRAQGASATGEPADTATTDAAEAQALFRRGLELGTEERWADALEHFRRSFARVPRPSTLFNIGLALGRLGRFHEAITTFDQLFSGGDLPADVRTEAERLRAEAVASLGEIALTIEPADAALTVDGASREGSGSPRVVPLDPGRHVLRGTAPEHDEAALEVSVVAGERTTGSLVLTPFAVPIVEPPPPSRSVFEEPAFWIVGGVIVVALGVGIGVGVGVGTAAPPPPYGGTSGVVLLAP